MTYISLLLNEKHSHAHTHEVWIVSTARREEYMFIIRNCSHLFKQNAQLYISHIFFFKVMLNSLFSQVIAVQTSLYYFFLLFLSYSSRFRVVQNSSSLFTGHRRPQQLQTPVTLAIPGSCTMTHTQHNEVLISSQFTIKKEDEKRRKKKRRGRGRRGRAPPVETITAGASGGARRGRRR